MNFSEEVETMNKRLLLSILGYLVAAILGLSGTALAQGGGGGGGGGGDTSETPDYGDQVILHRNEIGVPILDDFSCQQPLAFPENVGCEVVCDDDPCLIPIDTSTCTIPFEHATCANEADFGRTNVARADDDVLDFQLEDVLIKLATADCKTLDPAGRMVASFYSGDELKTSTIDSPLQNLSVYKHLVREGTIGVPLPQSATAQEMAARAFGVAMDKAGEVNRDLLVYLNEMLGLTTGETIFGNPECIDVREEVMGTMALVEKCFLNYNLYEGYDRIDNFSTLPSPKYIPQGAPEDGTFEYLEKTGENTYQVTEAPISATVFGSDVGHTGGLIDGFVQAADDTRAVINFMHSNPVPATAETPVPCTPLPDPTDKYDLSISSQSGLKVPKQVVSTTEGREFVLTVANAGPDTAAGKIVLTAVRDDLGDVLVEGFPAGGPFEFTFGGLLPGMSYTTGPVFFTLSEPHDDTTITWTATAEPDDVDPLMSNNEVVKTSTVRASSGGSH
jgi:hypothetical protein